MLAGLTKQRLRVRIPLLLATTMAVYAALWVGAAAGQVRGGGVTQLPGAQGCVVDDPAADIEGCDNSGRALDGAAAVAVSPDDRNVYIAASGSDAVATFARSALTGELTQLSGTAGCTSDTGAGECADGRALEGAIAVAVSPDGENVYVASYESDAVATFARDAETGELTQLDEGAGCIVDEPRDPDIGNCDNSGRALEGAAAVAVSPDGENVYVASYGSDAVATFARDTETGELTQLSGAQGCVSDTGSEGQCADGRLPSGARSIAVSPDGKNAYVGGSTSSSNGGMAVFARGWDAATGEPLASPGELRQLLGEDGCVVNSPSEGCFSTSSKPPVNWTTSITVSADGNTVHGTSAASSVYTFRRADDHPVGRLISFSAWKDRCVGLANCGPAAIIVPMGVVVSTDGRNAYVADGNRDAIVAVDRKADDPESPGKLVELGGRDSCIVDDPAPDIEDCDNSGRALAIPYPNQPPYGGTPVAVSPDGRNVYIAARDSDGVAAFARSLEQPPTCSDLPQTVRRNTPTKITLDCTDPNGDDTLTFTIVGSPQHGTISAIDHAAKTVIYTPDPDFPRPGATGPDSFRFRATDGTYDDLYAVEATQTITVVSEAEAAGPAVAAAKTLAAPTVKVFGRALRVSRRGRVRVGLRCRSADHAGRCRGILTLKTDRARNRKSGKRVRKLTLGKAKYSIPAGKTKRVRVRVRKSGRRLLRRQERRRRWVWVKATAKPRGAATTAAKTAKRTILLRAPRKSRHRKRGR